MTNKYGAHQVTLASGKKYASKKEYRRGQQLRLLQQAGKITDLQEQVKFVLIPAQYQEIPRVSKKTGKPIKPYKQLLERELAYVADYVYTDVATGERIVEDCKGFRTEGYILKRKAMLWIHGVRIKET